MHSLNKEIKQQIKIDELKLLIALAITRFGYSETISSIKKEDPLHEVVEILGKALNKIEELENEITGLTTEWDDLLAGNL